MYATMPAMKEHERARSWLVERFEDPGELVGLCWPVLYGFVRTATSRRIMADDAASLDQAWDAATRFTEQDNGRLIDAGPNHASITAQLLRTPGLTSDDVHDVQLAALAIEHGLELCSHDRGFARFDLLAWHDPLAGP